MIQNADDAGATEVSFLYDNRCYGTNALENPELSKFQGPALYCHNDATFKEEDWEGIQNLMRSNKKDDPLKVGRFGIGFNSVYHITGEWVNKTALRINFIKVNNSYRKSYIEATSYGVAVTLVTLIVFFTNYPFSLFLTKN